LTGSLVTAVGIRDTQLAGIADTGAKLIAHCLADVWVTGHQLGTHRLTGNRLGLTLTGPLVDPVGLDALLVAGTVFVAQAAVATIREDRVVAKLPSFAIDLIATKIAARGHSVPQIGSPRIAGFAGFAAIGARLGRITVVLATGSKGESSHE